MRPSVFDPDQPHHVVSREHVEAGFDGRCHFKRYGMECMRFYGHRGLHWTKPGSKMSDFYTCPVCDMTSHNPDDVASKYCGNCHKFEFECAQQAAIRKRRNTKSAPDDQSGQ